MNGNGAVFFPAVESIVYAACWIERGSMQGAGSAVKKKGHLVKAEKSVLLIVPHADDELFVGGGLLKTLAQRQGYECFVVYTTNSDYFTHEGEERIRESLRVLIEIYGIIKKNIFYLGYGDGWKSDRHLYNQEDFQIIESVAGRKETYVSSGCGEYRMLKSGSHSAYCRSSFKQDLKELLEDLMADIILAVDYDKHPDHKAASLMAEECIGELLLDKPDYHPLVLKRYAYDGVWKGQPDFFEIPRKRTILSMEEHSPYREEDRICIGMPPDCGTPYLARNFLYRAARCYRTQEVWQKADEIINIDEVFWVRNTDNLLREAEVTASSGNVEYLRDFKLFDCADITQSEFVPTSCGWLPADFDDKRHIRIRFSDLHTIAQINVYALGDEQTDVLAGEFVFDGKRSITADRICLDGKKNTIMLEEGFKTRNIDFYLTKYAGSPTGITEMEILCHKDSEIPEEVRHLIFNGDTIEYNRRNKMLIRAQKACWLLQRKLWSWFPDRYFLQRQYPDLTAKPSWAGVYRAKYFWSIIRKKLERIF